MNLLPAPGLPPAPPPENPTWRRVLFASAALVALCSCRPWVCVRFSHLFGDALGPPAWKGSAGFTCLMTAMLVAVMALAETNTATTQRAVRPASLMLAGVAAGTLLFEVLGGPGMLRGVSAMWTIAFYLVAGALPMLLLACVVRQLRCPRFDAPPFA